MNGWIFSLCVIGLLVLYKIVEQICYCICWLKSDRETRSELIQEDIKTVSKNKKGK